MIESELHWLPDNTVEITDQVFTLDELLSSIPPDFQYPDDVSDFVNSEPLGQEII